MEQGLIEKIKWWVCDTFGHIGLDGKSWRHGGQRHETCKFCRRIKSIKSCGSNNTLN